MKAAIVSHVLPPSWSGQSVMLYRLLRGLSVDSYCPLLTQVDATAEASPATPALPAPLHVLPPGKSRLQNSRFRLRPDALRHFMTLSLETMARGRKIADIVRREHCDVIVACTGGDLLDLPAGYRASRIAGVPFFPYIFDDYASQWCGPYSPWRFGRLRGRIGGAIESVLMRHAAGIIVPNEFMAALLHERYGVRAAIVRNPCDTAAYQGPLPDDDEPRVPDDGRIVYTGAVYEAHFDSFVRLLRAIESLGRPGLKLHLYTAQPASWLERKGIRGPVIVHGHVSATDVATIQRRADVLFLPLAFESPYPELIRTSAPGKIGEYLAARRPVLVSTPRDSFPAWYFRRHSCGLVVDTPSVEAVAQGLRRIIDDEPLRAELTRNAGVRATADFAIDAARNAFCRAIGMPAGEYSARPATSADDPADLQPIPAGAGNAR